MQMIGGSEVEWRSRKEQSYAIKLAIFVWRGPAIWEATYDGSPVYHIRATAVQPIRLLAVSSAGQGDVLSLLRLLEIFSSFNTLLSLSILNSKSH